MDLFAIIESAAQSGSLGINGIKAPTEAQKMAGNYKMGRCDYKGMQLVFEQPRNSYREGVSKDGKRWRNRMAAHYGYIGGTTGADGDGIDIFVGTNPESEIIYVINQVDEAGKFDETKAMIGFLNEQDARRAYQESYDKDWRGLGEIVPATVDQFKWWLKYGDTTKPISRKILPYDGTLNMNEIQWDSAALPVGTDLAGVIYALRSEDTDGLLLDSVTADDILEAADSVLALDALVVPVAQLDRKMKQLQNIMNMAGGELSVSAMQVTAPFKNRGTTNVAAIYELSDGQTVSIYMHNPDTTPNKLMPTDDLVSWKWMLNKKDITILVAPEKGQDLNPREVARRVMRLAEKNSARFAKANANRAARMSNIAGLKQQVEVKAQTLKSIEDEIEQVQAKLDDPTRAPMPQNSEAVAGAAAGDKPAWELTAAEYVEQEFKKNKYYEEYKEAPEYAAGIKETLYRKWREQLAERALVGRISDRSLDDLVAEFGIGALSEFRGQRQAGAENYETTETRLYDKTYQQVLAMAKSGKLGAMVATKNIKQFHRDAIQNALRRGAVVPEKVKAEYPDIFGGSEQSESELDFKAQDVANFGAVEAARRAAWFEKYGYEKHKDDPAFIALKSYLLKQFGTDNISDFSGGLVKGVKPLDAALSYTGEPTDQELAVHGLNRDTHAVMKALVNLGWTNKTSDMKSKVVWYVQRSILGGFKGSVNPEGVRTLSAGVEDGNLVAKHGDNVLASVPYDASKSAEENAKALNAAVDAIPNSGSIPKNDEVNTKIQGKDRLYNKGKIYKWDSALNRYATGVGSKKEILKISELSPIEIDGYSELSSFGNVEITDIGSENVYFKKNDIGYYTKLLNTDDWSVGAADFSKVTDPYERVAVQDPTTAAGYAALSASDKEANQDQLDSFFQKRIVDVRNALRALGWDGEQWRQLTKNGVTAQFTYEQVGAGKNIVGMSINGLRDDLSKSPADLAATIDANASNGAAPNISYKPASEYADTQSIKIRLAEIQQEELELTKKRAEMQESFTDYPDLKESLQREREELAARYKDLSETLEQTAQAVEQAEQAKYEKFSLSKMKMPTPTRLGAKLVDKGTGDPKIRIIGATDEGGWTNSHILDLEKRPAALFKVVENTFGKIGEGSSVKNVPEQAIDRVVKAAKAHEIQLEPVAIKDGGVIFQNERRGVVTVVDADYVGYFVKQYPNCEFFTTDASTSIAVRKGGKTVGIMMPMRADVDMKRALRAAQATDAPAQQAAQEPAPQSAPTTNPDREYLSKVIAGQVDVMAPDVADKLVAIAEQYAGDADMSALAEQAAEAYSAAVVEKAKAALA